MNIKYIIMIYNYLNLEYLHMIGDLSEVIYLLSLNNFILIYYYVIYCILYILNYNLQLRFIIN